MFFSIFFFFFFISRGLSSDLIEKDFHRPIEKILFKSNDLFVGTVNSLHRLSSITFNQTLPPLHFNSQTSDYHWKVLLSIDEKKQLLLCGTVSQGLCQIVDEDFHAIVNSSQAIVANDPVNSTVALIIPEKNLVYFAVTYTNEGVYRWQIPNLAGRSLNRTNFLKILSTTNDDRISRDDLSLRFMPRQQTTLIVQYIYGFVTKSFIYFITNQPNDLNPTMIITKIIRFCRNTSYSIIHSYSEIPLICSNTDWIIKSAQTLLDQNNQMVLLGLFRKRDGSSGTNICSWNIPQQIDRAFFNTYLNCYSLGIGQRGLSFIKPNEDCRKDESWSNSEDVCSWIISDRLPYPVGGSDPIVGHLFYENPWEISSAFQVSSFGSSIRFFHGLTNGTFKLGILDNVGWKLKWTYVHQLPMKLPILSEIAFDNRTASVFFASGSKIYRLSFASACSSRSSCSECLSSSNNLFCGWCSTTERCTLSEHCSRYSWQQQNHQCIHILNVSIDQSQWINLTLSKLPQLDDNEVYRCVFTDQTMTQAIQFDSNRLSCPSPSNSKYVDLSVIKWPSNTTLAEFVFDNRLSFQPLVVYAFGGQILHITGNDLLIGNTPQIFIGNDFQCISMISNVSTCRLPSLLPGSYHVTVIVGQKTILNSRVLLKVISNPMIQDIHPTTSFASGGRLITVRGMHFGSTQSITAEFSYGKWNTKLKIRPAPDHGTNSSFTFRTPAIPSAPKDVDFSLNFDDIIFLPNIIQFHYIPDILLNLSSIPPILPYTGEELKLQVDNLTDAASIEDIQLFIACEECPLKTFTSKGITCQPPPTLSLINLVDCSSYNTSIGPIRFRIGFREYLIGYLSYIRPSSVGYSITTIISLSLASCLLTVALLTFCLCLYLKLRKSKEKTVKENDEPFWSTTTSATAEPYYQVYEQIPSLSSTYHKQQLRNIPSFLTTLSIDHEQLKKLILTSDVMTKYYSCTGRRQSMEFFYDLLGLTPFAEAFIDQLVRNNDHNLLKSYVYLFRYSPSNWKSFPSTREISFCKLTSTFLLQSNNNLIKIFQLFDKLIHSLIDVIDRGPCDQLLNRSSHSISSSTLLLPLFDIEYQSLELPINYENLFRFDLSVLNCDTLDQIKQKIAHYLNSYEKSSSDQIDLSLPLIDIRSCAHQIPQLKQYAWNSTLTCRRKSRCPYSKEKNFYLYHLCMEHQLVKDKYLIHQRLLENKKRLQPVFNDFYQEISRGLKGFEDYPVKEYIQLVSDLIRRLHRLMISRSTCSIVQSCLNTVADGLEFLFQTKDQFSDEVELLFEDDRKHFTSIDVKTTSYTTIDSLDIRSIVLADDTAIECLFQLYQFYERHSESINQDIGGNHVSVLLPVHHLLVQIRQLMNSTMI